MPESSVDQTPHQLPSPLEIIQNQIRAMDDHVLALHALLDLLNRPDDQRTSLAEMISNLLSNLSDRQAQYQVELAGLTAHITSIETKISEATGKTKESQRQLHQKLDRILRILSHPVD